MLNNEPQDSGSEEFVDQCEINYNWIKNNNHLKKRQNEGSEYYEAICRAAAALITILQLEGEESLPKELRGKMWQSHRGIRKNHSNDVKGAFTINLDYLRKISELDELPHAADMRSQDSDIVRSNLVVIWQVRGNSGADEVCNEDNFVTSYGTSNVDSVIESRQTGLRSQGEDYIWAPTGRVKEKIDLRNQLLNYFSDSEENTRKKRF